MKVSISLIYRHILVYTYFEAFAYCIKRSPSSARAGVASTKSAKSSLFILDGTALKTARTTRWPDCQSIIDEQGFAARRECDEGVFS
jgi:hypothetical protein